MNVKNGEVWSVKEPLEKLAGMSFPVKTSLKIVKLLTKVREQYQILDSVKNGLVRKHGELIEETHQYKIEADSPKWAKFIEEFDELMEQDTELVFEKIELPSTLQIEPSILAPLEKFVTVQE